MKRSIELVVATLLGSVCPLAFAYAAEQDPLGQTAQASTPSAEAVSSEAQSGTGTSHENVLEEVVVTSARKRAENVQTTPITVTALSSDLLEQAHVKTYADLNNLAPNLELQPQLGSGGAVTVYYRGFGDFSNDPAVDPHVALFIDGIYNPAPSGTQIDMFDIGTVEVQGGPQGTLLGKNAPVGAIYITSAPPTGDLSGEVEGDYGAYAQVGLRGKINVPLIQDDLGNSILTSKFSAVYKEGGNWVHNIADNKDDFDGVNARAYRASFRFKPSEDFEWNLIASLDQERDPQPGQRLVQDRGAVPGSLSNVTQPVITLTGTVNNLGPGDVPVVCYLYSLRNGIGCPLSSYGIENATFTTRERSDQVLISSTMSYRFDPVTVTSVTGFSNYWLDDNLNDVGTPFGASSAFDDRTRYDQESEEIRISSNKGSSLTLDDTLDWVVGGYFSNFDYNFNFNLVSLGGLDGIGTNTPGNANVHLYEHGITQSYAVFSHLIANLNDKWTASFGIRRSWDKKFHSFAAGESAPYAFDIPAGFNNTSVEVGTAYQFDTDRMAYFRFAQGYQSGGFAGFAVGNQYGPELNDEYELGFKSDWLNKQLRLNVAIFDNELSQLQIESALPIPTPPGFLQETVNAGSATIQGAELEIIGVPNDAITAHLNLGYLHPRYNHYIGTLCSNVSGQNADCSGVPFAFAPKWAINVGGDYVLDLPNDLGTATFSLDVNVKSSFYPEDPPYPAGLRPTMALVNAGVKLQDIDQRYSLEFYGTNILDHHYLLEFSDPGGIADWRSDGRPAEWGMRIVAKFGP